MIRKIPRSLRFAPQIGMYRPQHSCYKLHVGSEKRGCRAAKADRLKKKRGPHVQAAAVAKRANEGAHCHAIAPRPQTKRVQAHELTARKRGRGDC